MRKIYIVRENEEDGRLLEALEAAGLSTDESDFSNPNCPRCGSSTLLAYTENDAFDLLTWYEVEASDGAKADAWYLVCSQFTCTYEEQVERVFDPMGAEIFDQDRAHMDFDEYSGIHQSSPRGMLHLINYLRSALEAKPNRKLEAVLDEAEWRYEDAVEQAQEWINRVPLGKRIRFSTWSEQDQKHVEVEGTFVSATDEGFMLLRDPGEEVMLVQADALDSWAPRRPEEEELPAKLTERDLLGAPDENGRPTLIMLGYYREMVVIREHHLQLSYVDRFGQYHVRCWDEAAARDLGLTPICEGYWEGVFRRADVEARYDSQPAVKVKGHWVVQWGSAEGETWTAVRTEDPDVAAALDLELEKPWFPPETEEQKQRYRPSWSGLFRNEEIEERKDLRTYHWPLPELQVPDSR